MMMVLDNWIDRSKKGEVCGVLGCEFKPETKCQICKNYYCAEDSKNHFH